MNEPLFFGHVPVGRMIRFSMPKLIRAIMVASLLPACGFVDVLKAESIPTVEAAASIF